MIKESQYSIGEGNGTPLQYSCLENPVDRGAWWAAVNGVANSRAQLSDFTFTFHFPALEMEMATHFPALEMEMATHFPALEMEMATHSGVLAWRTPGTGEPGGLRLWGHTELDTTEAT